MTCQTDTNLKGTDMQIDINAAARNIRKIWRSATDAEIESGDTWYHRAHDLAREIAPTVEIGAGVLAALSPQTSWDRNVVIGRRAFADGFASGQTGDNKAKADAIMAGAVPLDVLGGLKVRSFYANILDPEDANAVTIDRHAFDVGAGLRHYASGDRPGITPKRYAALSVAYARVAREQGVVPNIVQARTWETWRNQYAWRKVAKSAA